MATRIEIEYTRQFTDAVVQDIIGRGTVLLNVLDQLGAAHQSLPGYAMREPKLTLHLQDDAELRSCGTRHSAVS